jgi:biopolymer transport protein ExbB
MINKFSKAALIACLAFGLGNTAYAAQAVSMEELLAQVKQGRVKDAAENKARIEEFQRNRARQQQMLADVRAEQKRQEQRSEQLEDTFEANDSQIIDLERALQDRLGDLKELFGVLQQAAGDARGNFDNSLTQIQFPDRTEWLTAFAQKMGQTNRMPSMEEIERIWFELQREMTESGRVLAIPTTVINARKKNGSSRAWGCSMPSPTANTWSTFRKQAVW